jgi:hypothetical protein
MKNVKHLLFALLIFFSPLLRRGAGGEAFGQKILKDTMLHVVKSFQPTIADVYKMNDMPVVKDSIPPPPHLNYGINSKKIFTPFTVENLKSAKMLGEPLAKLYSTLLKIGGGNYNTPYAEIFYNNLRSKEMSYGAHLKHLSSKATYDGFGFGGFSDNEIGLYGKKFLRKHTLSANLDYGRDVVHYYGYDTSMFHITDAGENFTKQRYSNFGTNVSLQSHYTDSLHLNYLTNLKYYNLTDFYKTSENNICATADVSGYYEKQLVHVPVSVDYYNNRSEKDSTHSVIAGLTPYITSSGDKWSTRLGMGITVEGTQHSKSRFLFYPNIDFNYNVLENIIVPYAGISGGLKKNSLQTLTDENPFLVPAPDLKNTNTKWEMYGGVKGSISKNISYNTRTSFGRVQDMYFFVNDNSDFFKKGFNAIYNDVTLWNLHGELQFQTSEKIKMIAKGEYNKYTLVPARSAADTLVFKPWHKPLWQTTLTVNYNLKNKIIATADFFMYGTRYAYTPSSAQGNGITVTSTRINKLKPIFDANIGLEYRYSKKLSGFVKFNNLGFSRYYLWNNYPSQKFNFLAGVTMVF